MRRYAHRDDFFLLADEFAHRDLLALLGTDATALRRWRAGRTRIPWAAYQLVRENSRYGLAERDAAEHFNRVMLLQLNEALRKRIGLLEEKLVAQARLVDWGCANDPFVQPDPRAELPPL